MSYVTRDSGNRTTFDSGMIRDTTEGKINWALALDGPMFQRWAELLTRGSVKYEPRNWMKAQGMDEYDRFRESAFRHFIQWYYGADDGEDHAAAVIFNINGAEYVKQGLWEDYQFFREIVLGNEEETFSEPDGGDKWSDVDDLALGGALAPAIGGGCDCDSCVC